MAEVAVRHNVKTVGKNEGEVIVDNDRVVRERNPELDKLMEYLSSMSEMMKTEEDKTVKNNLCLNCMKEIIQHHEGTVKWRKLSFLCESIMEDADLDSLLVYFESFETLSPGEIDKMATGEHSYIVIRAALKKFVRLTSQSSSENKAVKACAKSLKALTTVYSREENSIIRRLRNKYSSLLFRDLISTLCGIIWKDNPTNQLNFETEIKLSVIPKSCRKQFNSLVEEILGIPNINDVSLCEKGSPALGLLLVISKIQRDDVRQLIVEHIKPENSELKEFLKSGPGSFLLERVIFAMDEAELKSFYDTWIRGRLEELFMHDKGNFLLQRMLVLSSESLFESAITQINALGLLRRAWFGGKAGIVARFTERAAQLVEEKQILIIQNLKSAISNEGEDNLARSLLNGQDAYQGGLICQSIVGFHGRARKLLIDDITSLTSDELSEIFDTPPGSFLLEKMAKNIPDKKFIEIIKHFPIDKIAFGRFGSRAVEGLWKNGSIKLRAALCEMLKEVHVELGQSQFGRHVNHKLRVTEYVKGQDRWRQNQMNTLEGEHKQAPRQGNPKAGNKRKNTDQKKSKKKKVEN